MRNVRITLIIIGLAVGIFSLLLGVHAAFSQPIPSTKVRLQSPRESSVQVNAPMSVLPLPVKVNRVTLRGKYPLELPRQSAVITIQRADYLGAPWVNLLTVDALPVTFDDVGQQAVFRTVTHKRNL